MGGDHFFSTNYGTGNFTDYEFEQRKYLVACCPHNAARYDVRKLSVALQRPGEPEVKLSNLVIGIGRTNQIRGGARKYRIRDLIHPNSLKTKKGTVYKQARESTSPSKHIKYIIPPAALGLSADQIQLYEDGN